MNGKHFVGKRVSSFEAYSEAGPITGIALVVDDNNEYLAGDQTGYVMEIECPYGTQAMADDILSKIAGNTYKGFRAENAILDPMAELGDGVTVNGVYSMLAYRKVNFGPGHMSEIAAPGENDIDHEYPYVGSAQREINRQLAKTRSLIAKSSEEINLRIDNEVEGLSSSFTVELDEIKAVVTDPEGSIQVAIDTLNGLTVTDKEGTTKIKGSSIETDSLAADSISADKIDLYGAIAWTDLSESVQNDINDAYTLAADASSDASSAYSLASSASDTADQVCSEFADVKITVGGKTYIDGSMIYTNSIYADAIHLGGDLTVYSSTYGNTVGGYLGYTTSLMDGSSGIHMARGSSEVAVTSNGARMMYGSTNNQIYVASANCGIVAGGTTYYFSSSALYPASSVTLGASGTPWGQIYSTNSAISTSDREKKNSIEYDIDPRYDTLWSLLKPCTGKYNDGTSDRTHMFLISQDVEQAIYDAELTSLDFAAFIRSPKQDGVDGYDYALRYEEFIPLIIRQVQKLQARVAELEGISV